MISFDYTGDFDIDRLLWYYGDDGDDGDEGYGCW